MAMDTKGAQRRARQLLQSATKGHGVFMARIGQGWAFPSLLAFSVGAFIKLGGDGLLPDAIATSARITATIILLISGVLALEIALFSIGDAIARRRITWRMVWDIALVFVVAPLETWTLYLLFTGQIISGPVDLMRAAEALMATAYLGTLVILPPTDRDFVRIIGSRAAERAMEKLESISLDEVGMGRLYQVQAVANDESLTWSQRADKLVSVMEELAPGEQERQHQQQVSELERRASTAEQRLAETITATKQQISDTLSAAEERAIEMTSRALTSLLAGVPLPEWLLQARPELADITLGKRATTRSKASANGGGNAPKSPSDAKRLFLANLDIAPAKAPDKSRRIYVRSSDIPMLSDGAIAKEEATALARRLGEGARDGLPYIAPLDTIMQELMERHKLSEATAKDWASITQSGADSDDKGAVIDLESRRLSQA